MADANNFTFFMNAGWAQADDAPLPAYMRAAVNPAGNDGDGSNQGIAQMPDMPNQPRALPAHDANGIVDRNNLSPIQVAVMPDQLNSGPPLTYVYADANPIGNGANGIVGRYNLSPIQVAVIPDQNGGLPHVYVNANPIGNGANGHANGMNHGAGLLAIMPNQPNGDPPLPDFAYANAHPIGDGANGHANGMNHGLAQAPNQATVDPNQQVLKEPKAETSPQALKVPKIERESVERDSGAMNQANQMGNAPPAQNVLVPNAGTIVPNAGVLVPNVGALLPNAGALVPIPGALVPNAGQPAAHQANGAGHLPQPLLQDHQQVIAMFQKQQIELHDLQQIQHREQQQLQQLHLQQLKRLQTHHRMESQSFGRRCRACGDENWEKGEKHPVCVNCKSFYFRVRRSGQQLVCVAGNDRCPQQKMRGAKSCRKCRYESCVRVGVE